MPSLGYETMDWHELSEVDPGDYHVVKGQTPAGLCEYNIEEVDVIKLANPCETVDGVRICMGK